MTSYQIIQGNHYINGQFVSPDPASFSYFDSENPATGKILGSFPEANAPQVESAYHSARDSFLGWREYSRIERAEYFLNLAGLVEERREEIARVISLETGKVYNESIAEVNEALHMAQYAFSTGRMPHGETWSSIDAPRPAAHIYVLYIYIYIYIYMY